MKWNDIYLTNNHLPDFSFISLISESETNVELHPKLKLKNILKFNNTIHSQEYYCIYLLVYLLRKLPIS